MRWKRAAAVPPQGDAPSNPLRWGDGSRAYPREGVQAIEQYFQGDLGRPAEPESSIADPPPAPGPSRLTAQDRTALAALAPDGFSTEDRDRVCYSFGRSYGELIAWRDHEPVPVTDGVVSPGTPEQLQDLLAKASELDVAVVPWGGGTSLVGGVVPFAGSHHAVITVLLGRLNRPLGIDPQTDTVRFQAGIRGPEIETLLEHRGLTLGHLPHSFEFSTLGGWISTASSGQARTRYGEILDRVTYAKWATPTGFVEWKAGEAGPHGVDPRLVLGSEGTVGILVEAGLLLSPSAEHSVFRAVLLPNWESGIGVLRALASEEPRPAVARISDSRESRFLLTLARGGSPPEEIRGLEAIAIKRKIANLAEVVLGIVSFDGTRPATGRGVYVLEELTKQAGGILLPGGVWPGFGDSWKENRYRSPALRDGLVPDGWALEVIHARLRWDRTLEVASLVRDAIETAAASVGIRARVHVQADQPAADDVELVWTVTYPEPNQGPVDAWRSLERAGYDALLHAGAILPVGPGIGQTRMEWAEQIRTPAELDELWRLKSILDPRGILNPRKLFPSRFHVPRPAD